MFPSTKPHVETASLATVPFRATISGVQENSLAALEERECRISDHAKLSPIGQRCSVQYASIWRPTDVNCHQVGRVRDSAPVRVSEHRVQGTG